MAVDRRAPARPRTENDPRLDLLQRLPERGERRHAQARRQAPRGRRSLFGGGTDGNRLLTAQTGAILLVLLAVLGITILRIGQLLSVHMFVGMLLIGPIALKMASTGYRFTRYYTRNPRYRQAGPPRPALRLIAPLVLISTIAVFGTGVALLLAGPSSRGILLPLHKASFIVWIAFTGLHVLGHIAEIPGALNPRYEGEMTRRFAEATEELPGMRSQAPAHGLPTHGVPEWDAHGTGRTGRLISMSGAMIGGIVLAVVSVAWFDPWLHAVQFFVGK